MNEGGASNSSDDRSDQQGSKRELEHHHFSSRLMLSESEKSSSLSPLRYRETMHSEEERRSLPISGDLRAFEMVGYK